MSPTRMRLQLDILYAFGLMIPDGFRAMSLHQEERFPEFVSLEFGNSDSDGLAIAMAYADVYAFNTGFVSCGFGVTVELLEKSAPATPADALRSNLL